MHTSKENAKAEEDGAGTFKLGCKKFYFETAIVISIGLIAWLIFIIPLIFLNWPSGEENASSNRCSERSPYLLPEDVCFEELDDVVSGLLCSQESRERIFVLQKEERSLTQLNLSMQFVATTNNEECGKAVITFLCQYSFPLCGQSGYPISPSSSLCEEIKDSCSREWKLAVGSNLQLPDCTFLPRQQICPPSENDTLNSNSTANTNHLENTSDANDDSLYKCSPGFYRDDFTGRCLPDCYSWTLLDPSNSLAVDVIVGTAAYIGFISGIVVLALSALKYKTLNFPSVLVMLMVVDNMVTNSTFIIVYMDKTGLLCATRNALESRDVTTPYCVISGMAYSYVSYQITIWALYHTIFLFWKVLFPFHSNTFEKSGKMKFVYGTCIIIGILLPFTSIIATMSDFAVDVRRKISGNESSANELFVTGGLGFSTSLYPGVPCASNLWTITYYSVFVPSCFNAVVCTNLILIVFWFIRKQNQNKSSSKGSTSKSFGTAEKKLAVIIFYFMILFTALEISTAVSSATSSEFVRGLQIYFFCEQRGHKSGGSCSRDYERYSSTPAVISVPVLFCLFPVVQLIFVINISKIKTTIKKLRIKWKKKFTSNSTSGATSTVTMTSMMSHS